jgi:hypothetical protein
VVESHGVVTVSVVILVTVVGISGTLDTDAV